MDLDIKKCVAIQTARHGSVGVPNKNIMQFHGKPMFTYPLTAAIESRKVEDVWVTTDDPFIIEWCHAQKLPTNIIERPDYLSTSEASHQDVIIHALEHIKERYEYVVLLLGNSIFTRSEDIDNAISILDDNPEASSVLSVMELNMFNPHRAFNEKDGRLVPFVSRNMPKNSNDRNAFPSTYFFNGSFCLCRYETILEREFRMPYSWIGNNPVAFKQDFGMELDASWQIPLMRNESVIS